MTGPAADHWRRQLEDWVIPQHLLDAVDFSPYEWPVALMQRRDRARQREDARTPTMDRILALGAGTVLDIGAGAGGSCLMLAAAGVSVTAVEPDRRMVEALRGRAAESGVVIEVVEGRWPEVAATLGMFDVVTATHVVHNVPDLVPFLQAMHDHAGTAVVVQEFDRHPWAHLGPYYQALHGVSRPTGPTVTDLAAVVEEAFGAPPHVDCWEGDRAIEYENWDEIVEFYGRRVVLPAERRHELRALLEAEFDEVDGRLVQATRQRVLCTVWWHT